MSPPSVNLPVELIENILSASPVKSLLRFKSVCKQWHAIISDPRFFRIHRIRRSKLPENQNTFVVWKRKIQISIAGLCLRLMRLEEDGKLTTISEFHHQYYSSITLSSCNGIFLLTDLNQGSIMLWNPYIRKSTKIMITAGTPRPTTCNLYHDEISDDYKIVVVDCNKYRVYSCKNRSWGEKLDFPRNVGLTYGLGVVTVVDGCVYALCNNTEEIVYFDVRDGKLDKFPQPDYDHVEEGCRVVHNLHEMSGRLCLSLRTNKTIELWVMERNEKLEHCWRKLMSCDIGKEEYYWLFQPMWLSNEDNVVIKRCWNGYNLSLYNCVEKRFQKIEFDDWVGMKTQFLQCQENLYMPVEFKKRKR